MQAIYGPVPSWRLGRSLGIDLLPGRGKTCTFDCVYCQLGWTTRFALERQVFVELGHLEAELGALPLTAEDVDYVTFSGTGEPTLAANLGRAIDLVKSWPALQGVPVAVLTNATLLSQPDVRRDLAYADLVAAKLDAPDEALYRAINRPKVSLTWAGLMEGIRAFRDEFHGRLALQMMLIRANRERVAEMADLARELKPDHVQLNTPLRSSPTPPLGEAAMDEIEEAFAGLPVINVYRAQIPTVEVLDRTEMRSRRPEDGHPKVVEKEVK